jgi:hypothetical protein
MVWHFLGRNGAGGLKMRRITVNVLNKKLQTSNKGWYFSMGVGQAAKNKPVTSLGLLAPEYEGSLILVKIRNFTPSNMSHSRRPEPSEHCCENLKTRKMTPHLNKHVMICYAGYWTNSNLSFR